MWQVEAAIIDNTPERDERLALQAMENLVRVASLQSITTTVGIN